MSGVALPTPATITSNHDSQPPPPSSNFSPEISDFVVESEGRASAHPGETIVGTISKTKIQDVISPIKIEFQQEITHLGDDQPPSSPNHVMNGSSSTNSAIDLLLNDATFQGIVQSIASDIILPEVIVMNQNERKDFLCSFLNTLSSLSVTANEENGEQDPNSTYCPVTSFFVKTSKLMKDNITKLMKDETTMSLKDKMTKLIKDIITKLMKDHMSKLTDELQKFVKETVLASCAENSNQILLEKIVLAVLDSIITVVQSSID